MLAPKLFITGTDTHIGKTFIASWLCIHFGYEYWKPIQSGLIEGSDTKTLAQCGVKTHPEIYALEAPLSPHKAAEMEGIDIHLEALHMPKTDKLIIEGAGGVLVPLNTQHLIIDVIKKFDIPALIVAKSGLGTINHTLLTLAALRAKDIPILGVIMNGPINPDNKLAIEHFGNTKVLFQIPWLKEEPYKKIYNLLPNNCHS